MNSPIAYVGGKSRLAKTIIPMIPEHQSYCEVFAGAGWVFFRKDPSRFETLNDLDGDLISFYKVVKYHLEEFLKQFQWTVCSREWFDDWNHRIKSEHLTDIQRAAMYYYIQRLCFGGRVRGRSFGVASLRVPKIRFSRMEEELYQVHMRLRECHIECLPWQEFIARYDSPEAFFFIDPPYYTKPVYRYNMVLEDFRELSKCLENVKARFLLTTNDHPTMREVFSPFEMNDVSLMYSVNRQASTVGKELIFTNYHPTG